MLGKAKFYEYSKQYASAIDCLNQVIVLNPWFTPAVTEKAKVLLMMGDWDQCHDACFRMMAADNQNIPALQMMVLYHLCREARYVVAASRMAELLKVRPGGEIHSSLGFGFQGTKESPDVLSMCAALCSFGSANPTVSCHDKAQTFVRVLQQAMEMMERAMELSPQSAQYVAEYATLLLMAGRASEALTLFKKAMDLDETDEDTLNGFIACLIELQEFEEAKKQLGFLNEIQQGIGKNSQLLFLTGLLSWREDQDRDTAVKLLGDSIDAHFKSLTNLPLGLSYFSKLNPDFLIAICKEFLSHSKMDPLEYDDSPSIEISKAIHLLETICKALPGHGESMFLLAKCRLHSGNLETAKKEVDRLLKLNATYGEVTHAHKIYDQLGAPATGGDSYQIEEFQRCITKH